MAWLPLCQQDVRGIVQFEYSNRYKLNNNRDDNNTNNSATYRFWKCLPAAYLENAAEIAYPPMMRIVV